VLGSIGVEFLGELNLASESGIVLAHRKAVLGRYVVAAWMRK